MAKIKCNLVDEVVPIVKQLALFFFRLCFCKIPTDFSQKATNTTTKLCNIIKTVGCSHMYFMFDSFWIVKSQCQNMQKKNLNENSAAQNNFIFWERSIYQTADNFSTLSNFTVKRHISSKVNAAALQKGVIFFSFIRFFHNFNITCSILHECFFLLLRSLQTVFLVFNGP